MYDEREPGPHYTFLDGTLIEALPKGGHRLYKGADQNYWCAHLCDGEGPEPTLPAFARLFDDHGNALALADDLGEGRFNLASGQSAIDRYVGAIPIRIRRAAGSFDHLQMIVVHACTIHPGFVDFIEGELQSVGPGYVATCLVLGLRALSEPDQRSILLDEIIYAPRSETLSKLLGRDMGLPFARLLRRLDVTDLREINIWRLVELFDHPDKRRHLAATDRLTTNLIFHLPKVPPSLCSPAMTAFLNKLDPVCAEFDAVFPPFVLNAGPKVHQSMVRSTKGLDTEEVTQRLYDWVDELRPPIPFPPPPLPADDFIRPISDSRALHLEGKRMANCVGGYFDQVLEGRRYFYQWRGRQRATVELVLRRGKNWSLGEYKGFCNLELDARAGGEIEAHFEALKVANDPAYAAISANEKAAEYSFE